MSSLRPFHNSNKCFVKADKTKNIYELDKHTLDNLLLDNITNIYKKTNPATYNKINNETKELAVKLKCVHKITTFVKFHQFDLYRYKGEPM